LAHSEAAGRRLEQIGVDAVRGDLLDLASLTEAMRGCSLVFNVAGVNSHCPKDPDRLMRVNSEGPAQVVRAAASAGVKRVIHTSSATTIGEALGTVGREDSPHRGSFLSLYDQAKFLGERAAFAAGEAVGVEVVSLNPSSVQGPPRKGGNGAIIIAYLNGRLRAFVDTYLSLVDVQDVVAAHLLAAEHGLAGERYILNGASITTDEALRLLQELSGLDYRPPIVPARVARALARTSEAIFRIGGTVSPICRARVDTILHGHRYDGSKAARELGFAYTPVRDTFARIIEWAVAEGLVKRDLPRHSAR
jgi:dihydroflavonol-4-reductase